MNDIEILENMRDNIYGEMQFEDDYQVSELEEEEFHALNSAITALKERQADKDRIKEKIEWLREISDNGINAVRFAATHDDEIERMQKQKDISTMIGILQELLRESD